MIYFTDLTINEAFGNFNRVKELMNMNTWMIESRVNVVTPEISTNFLIHFWHDGKIVIFSTDRILSYDVPDDDIRELNEWGKINGWGKIFLHKDLTEDQRMFEYWMQFFRAGLVDSEEMQAYDKAQQEFFAKSGFEQEDDEKETNKENS